MVEVLTGLRKASEGKILVDKTDITGASPRERISLGISHVPEDRHKRGLIPDFSVMENLILGSHNKPPFTIDRVRLNFEEATNYAKRLISDFSIKTPNKDTPVQHLSGGTQHKEWL